MASGALDFLWNRFNELSELERVEFLERAYKNLPYAYNIATMAPSERKFYDTKAKR
jgi:hypothetical protein